MSRVADPRAKISLLRAAEAVFADRGLAAAKVEEISKRAGLSKGAFYLHFTSKEEAFKQVVESFLARLTATLPDPLKIEIPTEPVAALHLWADIDLQVYEMLWQNRAIVRILQGCQGAHDYLLATFEAGMLERNVQWVDRWKKHGYFRRDLDSDVAATVLCGAHQQISKRLMASEKQPPIAEWLLKAQCVFVRGFGTPRLADAVGEFENRSVTHRIQPAARRAKAS